MRIVNKVPLLTDKPRGDRYVVAYDVYRIGGVDRGVRIIYRPGGMTADDAGGNYGMFTARLIPYDEWLEHGDILSGSTLLGAANDSVGSVGS